jgi:hypothetical protein
MVPMRSSTIFKSRWMALLWAAGIIWFAYDFAGSQPQDSNSSAASANSDDLNQAAAALNSL